jgi:hypothetical protein
MRAAECVLQTRNALYVEFVHRTAANELAQEGGLAY